MAPGGAPARALAALAFLVGTALAPGVVTALTPVARTFAELARLADVIVVGTVLGTQGVQSPGGAIVTDVTVEVTQAVKGGHVPGTPMVLRVLGGTVGALEMEVVGAPRFQPGQRVVLFVRGNQREAFPFVGVQQGVFRLASDPGGVERVHDWRGRPVAGVHDDRVVVPATPGAHAMTVADFLREVGRALVP